MARDARSYQEEYARRNRYWIETYGVTYGKGRRLVEQARRDILAGLHIRICTPEAFRLLSPRDRQMLTRVIGLYYKKFEYVSVGRPGKGGLSPRQRRLLMRVSPLANGSIPPHLVKWIMEWKERNERGDVGLSYWTLVKSVYK